MHSAGREAQTKAEKHQNRLNKKFLNKKHLIYMAANIIFWEILFFLGKWTFQGTNDT